MAKGKEKSGKLSVFKGREARLNRAIFHTLAHRGPQTIYDIHKEVKGQKGLRRVRYASINKRVRLLEESSFIEEVGSKKTKAGFEAALYELATKAWLALVVDSVNLDEIITHLSEPDMMTILAALASNIFS